MLQCATVFCSVLQCVAVCVALFCTVLYCVAQCCSELQFVAVFPECCSAMQCVATCCSVLQLGTSDDQRPTSHHSCVTWLIRLTWHIHVSMTWMTWMDHITREWVMSLIHVSCDPFTCDVTHSCVTRLIHLWHDSFIFISGNPPLPRGSLFGWFDLKRWEEQIPTTRQALNCS